MKMRGSQVGTRAAVSPHVLRCYEDVLIVSCIFANNRIFQGITVTMTGLEIYKVSDWSRIFHTNTSENRDCEPKLHRKRDEAGETDVFCRRRMFSRPLLCLDGANKQAEPMQQ